MPDLPQSGLRTLGGEAMKRKGEQFKGGVPGYDRGGRELNRMARRLAPQGDADRLWEMADYHAVKGNRNEENEYRAAAKLKEQG